ncbi:MAG: NACHT domain-containing protein [Elainella sp.]
MTAEEAVAIVDQVLQQGRLSDVQEIVFRQCWDGQTYAEIAEQAGYDTGYIKDVGAKLWQMLSTSLGEKVTKSNVQSVLRRQQTKLPFPTSPSPHPPTPSPPHPPTHPHCHWGDAIDVSNFCGRIPELVELTHWLIADRCRVVSLLGMGGIGKTSLSIKLGQQLAAEPVEQSFQQIIWRSLRNGPQAMEMLADWLHCLTGCLTAELPDEFADRLSLLIQTLRTQRCLLILDNAETILQGGEYSGYFRAEHQGYGELLQRLAELPHQSCLLLTSRENPRPLMILEGETLPVRAMRLSGIGESAAREILQAKGLFAGSDADWQTLTERYAGNPLALKVVATTIQELYDGNIAEFLAEGVTVFDDIRDLLNQQFHRLSKLEQGVMYWLAVQREPLSIAELQQDLVPPPNKSKLIEAVNRLRWRSLIDKTVQDYTQQPVVMEYVTEQLIEQISEEIIHSQLNLFLDHALIKAPIKDYVRDSQLRLILQPILDRLIAALRGRSAVERHLGQLLNLIQAEYKSAAGYAAGNLLNLFRQLKTDLSGVSFAELPIWQAYLVDVPLHQVDFSQTQIRQTVFAQTLGSILAVAFSPDGRLLASSDAEGEICLWQVSDGKQILRCKDTQNHWVWSVCFSPDSQTLISSSEDKVLRVWNVSTGECLQELRGHSNWIFAVAFHPSSEYLASSSEDQTVRIWKLDDGECFGELTGHQAGVRSVAFSPDGQKLASGSSDGSVRIWTMPEGSCLQGLHSHSGAVRSVQFSPDGVWLASGGDDQILRLWQVETGELVREFPCSSRIWSVAFSPNSQFLLTGSDDQICLWERQTPESIRQFEGHSGMVLSVAFSPEGSLAASGSDDQTIRFWEVDTGRCLQTLKGRNNWVWSVAFNPRSETGLQLASAHEDQTVRFWQATGSGPNSGPNSGAASLVCGLEGHQGRIWSLDYSPDGQFLASGSDDQTIRFWQTGTGRSLKVLRGQTGPVRLVKFSPDGQLLASNSGDQTVKLWDVRALYARLQGETSLQGEPNRKTQQPTLGQQISGYRDEFVSGQSVTMLSGEFERVFALDFHPQGDRIATGSDDAMVRIWETRTGTCLQTLTGHQKPVEAVAFQPRGDLLASGSDDQVRLWRPQSGTQTGTQTGNCVATLNPGTGRVLCLAFSPDADLLAIGGSSGSIVLWDLATQVVVGVLAGHTKTVQSLAFSADSQYLVSGSEDETIRLWSVTQQSCWQTLRVARPYEGLNLTGATGLTAAQIATLKLLGAVL